jgi:HSP20 family protein
VPPSDDLFANLERMRREMGELFGIPLDRPPVPRRPGGFSPAVDLYYADRPPRAVVRADLAGIDLHDLDVALEGRDLVLAGARRPEEGAGRVYQQVEIEHGPFRRVISLGVDVDAAAASASYQDGVLVVELPIRGPAPPRTVPIESGDGA